MEFNNYNKLAKITIIVFTEVVKCIKIFMFFPLNETESNRIISCERIISYE